MTFDVVALCGKQPEPGEFLAALLAAGPELRLHTVDETQLVQLFHEDGRLMLTTEGARLVQVAGEVARLLRFQGEVPHPVWWVESRAPGHDREAESVARRFTHALLTATGGMSWSSR
ncbi:hypothetical protein FNH05_02760 [Amycolatopsis rhizosphaerae]|uniref:DUF2218 domain-containing protein n=1 Tax=Amycolatopsis rhizosphaerae TaxID=2053003 RepID=A0A558DKR0_9PSEU|nr:hypothetical protein [Amycolatopsis rhizosphaerae]TVT61603.1 hypothetical protein FNH05_02760 [Amycolatopsis rhizosphaerae]